MDGPGPFSAHETLHLSIYICMHILYVCVVVRVSRLHVAGKNNEIASRERSSFKVS